jgi:hypothetical protein
MFHWIEIPQYKYSLKEAKRIKFIHIYIELWYYAAIRELGINTMFRPLEYTRSSANENRPDQDSLQMRAHAILSICAQCGNEENRQKALFILVAIIGVAGIAALFSTAFSTCSKISLENKTSESVIIYGVGPLKTKVSSSTLLPYTTTTITLNGYNSYADLYTSAGQMHFSDFGKKGTLKDGANNKGIEAGSPPIFFWVCNQNYVKVSSSSSNATSLANFFVGSTSYVQGLTDFFIAPLNTTYLRGSSNAQTQVMERKPVFSFRKSEISFYTAQEEKEKSSSNLDSKSYGCCA